MKILFKLATRSRPEKARASINNIISNCNSNQYQILVSVDKDDETMQGFDHEHESVFMVEGTSKNKIDAIIHSLDSSQQQAIYAKYLGAKPPLAFYWQLEMAYDNLLTIAGRRINA